MIESNIPFRNNTTLNIRLRSLNCSTILKAYKEDHSDNLIKIFKEKKIYVFACQEANIPTENCDEIVCGANIKFQVHRSIWITHCGIINNNKNIDATKSSTHSNKAHNKYAPYLIYFLLALFNIVKTLDSPKE